ncbi:MAG: phage tail protein [Myxococcales bacterium]|nr:phage tail protein [Myxococcales bacterium]
MSDLRISVKGEVRAVLADLEQLGRAGGNIHRATASALLRAGTTVVSRSSREIAKASGLPARLVRGRFGRIRNAGFRRLVARWRVRLSPAPVRVLGAVRQTRRGVTVGRRSYPGAFIARNKHGHDAVFRRQGPPRLPLDEIAEPLVAADETIRRHMRTTGPERFRIEFQRAARQELRGGGLPTRRRRR